MSLAVLLDILEKHAFTRYPVKDKIDGRIKGYINAKELLTKSLVDQNISISDLIHEIPNFLETSPIKEALLTMQKTRKHMALIHNEEKQAVGIVTMEDVLEEIVGEIGEEGNRVN